MNKKHILAAVLSLALMLSACGAPQSGADTYAVPENAVEIRLSDEGVVVDGTPAGTDGTVYTANDIVYYESGKDITYGEGTEADAHSAAEAAAHTVVHITQPGTYAITGSLSRGQIAVDLGEDAAEDPAAVVTLILNGVDITCQVAPAVIFYNVYECGDADGASWDVDTAAAGANVVIADGTVNTVSGSYVARIYRSDSVVLNEDGTAVEEAKKLHKYDGAFYSRMSMNLEGGTGVLNIHADNEGLDSEFHLTVNGGVINIFSGNDGINTNEDGVSVTTVNGGTLSVTVTGETGEGDGIDSNGWLVINGGTVIASACASSADAGIDSDMGIHINGGTVIAAGHMLDRIEDSGQTYAVFSFAGEQQSEDEISLKNESGESVMDVSLPNSYSVLLVSGGELVPGTYTLWSGGEQLAGQNGGMAGDRGMGMPGGAEPPEGTERPEGTEPPEGMERPEGGEPPEGMEPPEDGRGGFGPGGFAPGGNAGDRTAEFEIGEGGNQFSGVGQME